MVIWLELEEDMEIEVALAPFRNGVPLSEIHVRGWPVKVGKTWYAWICCGLLFPDTWYEYRITGRVRSGGPEEIWPDRTLTGLTRPSRFRTLPLFSASGVRGLRILRARTLSEVAKEPSAR